MHKHHASLAERSNLSVAVTGATPGQPQGLKQKPAPRRRLLHADILYTQLSQLGLVTPHFDAEYGFDRRLATNSLLQQLVIIQKLYQGEGIEDETDSEELRIRAMHLNTHLINTAGFGVYTNAARVNILYQLRRILEKMLKKHFGTEGRLSN